MQRTIRIGVLCLGAMASRFGVCFAALFAVVVLFGAAEPAMSSADWSPAVNLRSLPGVDAIYDRPQVGLDADGDAIFVWTSPDSTSDCYAGCMRVQARVRSADGSLSPIKILSPAGLNAGGVGLAVAPNGAAVVTWSVDDTCSGQRCSIPQVRTRSPAGELGPIQTIARDYEGSPYYNAAGDPIKVAIDASGEAPIVWRGSNGRVKTRTVTANGSLTGVRPLSPRDRFATDPEVAVNARGEAVFAWVIHAVRGGRIGKVQSRRMFADGTLTWPQRISGAGRISDPRVALDPSGDTAFAWLEDGAAMGRVRSAAGVLGSSHALSDPDGGAEDARVGIDDAGTAVFGWTTRWNPAGGSARVQTRTIAGGDMGPVGTVVVDDAPYSSQRELELGVDRRGNTVFSWVHGNASCTEMADCGRLQTATRSLSGDQTAIETLSTADEQVLFFSPALAVTPGGDAAAVWLGSPNYEDSAIEGAVRSGPPSF